MARGALGQTQVGLHPAGVGKVRPGDRPQVLHHGSAIEVEVELLGHPDGQLGRPAGARGVVDPDVAGGLQQELAEGQAGVPAGAVELRQPLDSFVGEQLGIELVRRPALLALVLQPVQACGDPALEALEDLVVAARRRGGRGAGRFSPPAAGRAASQQMADDPPGLFG